MGCLGQTAAIENRQWTGLQAQSFQSFCKQMDVQLNHGLPYNPQGQGIVERAQHTLKECLLKQKGGIGHGRTPKEQLSLALFTLNFLNRHLNKFQIGIRIRPLRRRGMSNGKMSSWDYGIDQTQC